MCLLDLLRGLGGAWEAVEIACTFLGRLLLELLGGPNAKIWDDHQKKKLFINNSIEDLTPFKEELVSVETHVLFLGGGEVGLSPKRGFI